MAGLEVLVSSLYSTSLNILRHQALFALSSYPALHPMETPLVEAVPVVVYRGYTLESDQAPTVTRGHGAVCDFNNCKLFSSTLPSQHPTPPGTPGVLLSFFCSGVGLCRPLWAVRGRLGGFWLLR